MKKTQRTIASIIVLIILTFFAGPAWAWVHTGNYDIDTSSDIAALSGCTEITGALHIEIDTLTSLSGMESLKIVGGYLWIDDNDALESLSGLDNLTSVGGDLAIHSN